MGRRYARVRRGCDGDACALSASGGGEGHEDEGGGTAGADAGLTWWM